MSYVRTIALGYLPLAVAATTLGGPVAESQSSTEVVAPAKPRIVVTTDPELDDSNSLVRYLLFSSDFRTEGLIYGSSGFHWKGDGNGTKWFVAGREYTRFGLELCPCESWRWTENEQFIEDAVTTYAEVYENLIVHDPGYPTPASLRSAIAVGNVEFDGDISRDSPGSELIASLLLDEDRDPLYLLAWGGLSTIARALKAIEERHADTREWPQVRSRVSSKAVIQSFGDQDDTYAGYIGPHWPEIEFRDMATRTWGYFARDAVLPGDLHLLSAKWTRDNVSSRGPLGAFYRVWGDGRQMVEDDIFDFFGFAGMTAEQLESLGYIVWTPVQEPGSWISEGDSTTFLNLVDNGLRAFEDAAFGGWGGRRGVDVGPTGADPQYSSARFFAAAQRAFAARMRWSVEPTFEDANHGPAVGLEGSWNVSARPGDTVDLIGLVDDPDGDAVAVNWWQYAEAGSYPRRVTLSRPADLDTSVLVPTDARPGETIHLILEVTDDGSPPLTAYGRVIVSVAR